MSTRTLHTRWPIALMIGVAGSLVVGVLVLAFMWPNKTSEPKNLPVSVAGPAEAVAPLTAALDGQAPGTIDVVPAADRDEAVQQIRTRQTYGAIVLAAPGTAPEVLTAPAASPVAAQLLSAMATQLQDQLAQQVAAAGGDPSTVQVEITVVVPLSADDPTGAGMMAASFPLMMGGMIGGILASLAVVGVVRRLVTLAGFGLAVGVIVPLVLQVWFGYLQGNFWLNALGIGLGVLATSSLIVGLASLLGRPGIAVGAVFTMLIANPIAGGAMPWEFLAEPWGAIGQFLVPGAANSLIRSLSYFPDASQLQQWLVLGGWTVLGVVLAMVGRHREEASMHVPESSLVEA